ncbi:MAG TPA: transglutaminase domain-containing protein, partial [Candidatus Dojkabacteria bacterium]|nr:transglutaminase domain-containing protein [Candidatus Dojkabacteria bacterium]
MIKKFTYILTIFALVLTNTGIFSTLKINAAAHDIDVTDSLTINYENTNDYVTVLDQYSININNTQYYYRPGIELSFILPNYANTKTLSDSSFKLKNLDIRDIYGQKVSYTTSVGTQGINITVTIGQRISNGNPYTLKISYKTHELIGINGNIKNIYIPGLPKDTKFEDKQSGFNLTYGYTYEARVITDSQTPAPTYVQPSNMTITKEQNRTIYSINAKDRLGKSGWLQLGNAQYYYFKIEDVTPKTDNITPTTVSNITKLASTNVYRLMLPRELDETKQKVFIKEITPAPKKITRDDEGNLIAVIDVPANIESKITVEGYIQESKEELTKQLQLPEISIQKYLDSVKNMPSYSTYISAEKYWEVNDPVIQNAAKDIKSKLTTDSIKDLLTADYKYIIDKFNYSYDKINNGNERLGAKAALLGSQTICMEYSDALTAILRAQGIPSRIAIGYGNDPFGTENLISNDKPLEQRIGHQWTQVWIPDYGWLSLDPTWGESQRTYIGSDLDHILLYAVGNDKENVSDVLLYTADNSAQINLNNYKFFLQ